MNTNFSFWEFSDYIRTPNYSAKNKWYLSSRKIALLAYTESQYEQIFNLQKQILDDFHNTYTLEDISDIDIKKFFDTSYISLQSLWFSQSVHDEFLELIKYMAKDLEIIKSSKDDLRKREKKLEESKNSPLGRVIHFSEKFANILKKN